MPSKGNSKQMAARRQVKEITRLSVQELIDAQAENAKADKIVAASAKKRTRSADKRTSSVAKEQSSLQMEQEELAAQLGASDSEIEEIVLDMPVIQAKKALSAKEKDALQQKRKREQEQIEREQEAGDDAVCYSDDLPESEMEEEQEYDDHMSQQSEQDYEVVETIAQSPQASEATVIDHERQASDELKSLRKAYKVVENQNKDLQFKLEDRQRKAAYYAAKNNETLKAIETSKKYREVIQGERDNALKELEIRAKKHEKEISDLAIERDGIRAHMNVAKKELAEKEALLRKANAEQRALPPGASSSSKAHISVLAEKFLNRETNPHKEVWFEKTC
jgi:chromosome segregation ATPase